MARPLATQLATLAGFDRIEMEHLGNLELKDRAPSFALTYVDILSLSRESFYRILDNPNFGRERGIVRRACAYMSFRLGVLRVTRLVRDGDTRAVDFLLDAHDAADGGAESAGAGGGAALSASGLQQRRQSVKDIKRLLSGADGDAGGGGAAGEPELPGARSSFDGCNPRELFGRDSRKSADRARGARGSRDDAELGAKVEARASPNLSQSRPISSNLATSRPISPDLARSCWVTPNLGRSRLKLGRSRLQLLQPLRNAMPCA